MRRMGRVGRVGSTGSPNLTAKCSSRAFAGLLLLVAAAGGNSGCGGAATFALSSEDNSATALARAFQLQRPISPSGTANERGPMAFLVTTGKSRQVVAWDLAAGKPAWTVESEASSRIAVGRSQIAYREGNELIVVRAIADGRPLWTYHPPAKTTFLGLAADDDTVFSVVQDDTTEKRSWYLAALREGKEIWRADAPGTLGAPAAVRGLVFMPFMTQWLTILDARTGEQLARIRQEDESINFVRASQDTVCYGSRGVFLLDEKSVTGTKQDASYLTAKLPDFVRPAYYFDAFQPIQASYSAYDRNRILWHVRATDGEFAFRDNTVVVFSFRFFFGFDAVTGSLRWAQRFPRHDVVAAEHVGPAILYVSQEGELGAIDPANGAELGKTRIEGKVLGATFDADGYRPSEGLAGKTEAPQTREVLVSIVRDRDARFDVQKLFALTELGRLPGADVTSTLLGILKNDDTSQLLYDKASEVLIARRDVESVPVLVDALKTESDFLEGTKPRALEVTARALAAIANPQAAPALIKHLEDPDTPLPAVREIAIALAACGNKEALPALRRYLLLYRVDPSFDSDVSVLGAVIDALLSLGTVAERELVAYVAEEPRTQPKIAEYARRAMASRNQAESSGANAGANAGANDR
ncbi:MAG: PQQ-binding-like beta-propeller repeat protein [Pseudomonadota bacterium]